MNQIGDPATIGHAQQMERNVLLQSTILSLLFIVELMLYYMLPQVLTLQLMFIRLYAWIVMWASNIFVYLTFS